MSDLSFASRLEGDVEPKKMSCEFLWLEGFLKVTWQETCMLGIINLPLNHSAAARSKTCFFRTNSNRI